MINTRQSLEARHQDVLNNVYRNCEIYGSGAQDVAGGIKITNGAHDNWFENIYVHNAKYGIGFGASGEDPTAPDGGSDNIIVNSILKVVSQE